MNIIRITICALLLIFSLRGYCQSEIIIQNKSGYTAFMYVFSKMYNTRYDSKSTISVSSGSNCNSSMMFDGYNYSDSDVKIKTASYKLSELPPENQFIVYLRNPSIDLKVGQKFKQGQNINCIIDEITFNRGKFFHIVKIDKIHYFESNNKCVEQNLKKPVIFIIENNRTTVKFYLVGKPGNFELELIAGNVKFVYDMYVESLSVNAKLESKIKNNNTQNKAEYKEDK